ncbi:MAG: four helix bundle protein [Phycisphaeraceae bacterium]|nr:four helix bundle protein [Phycisphaeraceae bacterium]
MTESQMKARTKKFALRVMKMVASLPDTNMGRVIGGQVLRSATSVGANYRAACRARSKAEFSSKFGIVEEETDETSYWIELLIEGGILPKPRLAPLLQESNELLAIVTASRVTLNRPKSKI